MQYDMNDGWRFARLPVGSEITSLKDVRFVPVKVPHDWLIEHAERLYEDGDGWYLRDLEADDHLLSSNVFLHFDGIYMDATIYLNGEQVAVHEYGYTAFSVPLSGRLLPGLNRIHVRVRHQAPNSRWYSGAGIYRNVTLRVYPERFFEEPVYAHPKHVEDNDWQLMVRTTFHGEGTSRFSHRLMDADGYEVSKWSGTAAGETHEAVLRVHAPKLWSPSEPYLYTLETRIMDAGRMGDEVSIIRIGFRETVFSPESGFILNGQPVKLHGVCLHHDLGALGSAFHRKAAARQLRIMQEMGVNALRTSHNPPATEVLDLCDEMGILVIDEFTDVWERQKTTYDYARFFRTHATQDIRDMVLRDRSHPCVILWSIGNEIMDTFAGPEGAEWTRILRDAVREADPLCHGGITIGSNYMPWEGAQNCADILKIAGYNYAEKYYESHHQEHPDWVIYGSETMSSVQSRGIYHFPITEAILTEEDLQCSSLGNSLTSWGTRNIQATLVEDLRTPYSMGQFVWSGMDYIGEPTPYHTRNSYFGQVDTAGFPKDTWYQYRAAWVSEPVLHIGVSWDWNPGQRIDIPVYSNCAAVELFLNGRSLGCRTVVREDPQLSLPIWQCEFEAGELKAVGYNDENLPVLTDVRRSSGDAFRLRISAEPGSFKSDGRDICFLNVDAVDLDGVPVENACDLVHIRVTGPACILGADNGDSTDTDEYMTDTKRLFSGRLLVILGALNTPGTVTVEVSAAGLEPAVLSIPVLPDENREAMPAVPVPGNRQIPGNALMHIHSGNGAKPIRARLIRIRTLDLRHLTPERPEADFALEICPAAAQGQPVEVQVTDIHGIRNRGISVSRERNRVRLTGRSDGLYLLRASCRNGTDHARVLSQLEVTVTGFGKAALNPYEFISASLFTISDGAITPGNEKGIAFARDGRSLCGFENVDFGPEGSDTLMLPLFALTDDPFEITLWDGDPGAGGIPVMTLKAQQKSIWNVYQMHTFMLPVCLTGIHTLCFSMQMKVHMKGFRFLAADRASRRHQALSADAVYGDQFKRTESGILGIGNNVTVQWNHLEFGQAGLRVLRIDGQTPAETSPVQVRITDSLGQTMTEMCQFTGRERSVQVFRLQVPEGVCSVSFVFLPGSVFDFYSFEFTEEA